MKNLFLKYRYIIFAIIAMLLFTFWFFRPRSLEKQTLIVSNTPTPPSTSKFQQTTPTTVSSPTLAPAQDKLPFVGEKFTIQYLPNQNKYLIIILKNPFKKNQQEALIYLGGLGVATDSAKISFGSSRGVSP